MNERLLPAIERSNLWLGVAVAAVAGLLAGPAALLAAGAGAVLGGVNFHLLARMARVARARAERGDGNAAYSRLMLGVLVKMPLMLAAIWLAVGVFGLAPAPFVAGLAVFLVSAVGVVGLGAITDGGDAEARA